jgi:hypothetical protein
MSPTMRVVVLKNRSQLLAGSNPYVMGVNNSDGLDWENDGFNDKTCPTVSQWTSFFTPRDTPKCCFVELRQRFVGARQLFSGFAVPLQREIKKQSVWN